MQCQRLGIKGGQCKNKAAEFNGMSIHFCKKHKLLEIKGIKQFCKECELGR